MKKTAKLTPRNYIITIALAAAALAYVFLVFLPAQASISELRSQLQQKQHYIVASDRLSFSIDQTRERLIAVRKFNADWTASAPAAGQLSPVLAAISKAAADAGVMVVRLEPKPEEPYDTIAQAEILLVCEGEFAPLMDFIYAVESHASRLWITSIDVAQRDAVVGQPQSASMQASLNLVAFADKRGNSD